MRNATLKQMRCLAAVIRTGSVTGAAAALNVTPPAITAQVKSLEELAGAPLVERVGDRFRATPAGAEIDETLARIEALLGECGDALAEIRSAGAGKVSLGVVSTARYFAPRAIAAFRAERPGVRVNLMVGNREETIAALRGYEIDIALMGRPPGDFAVEATRIGAHPLVMIAPPGHRLAGRRDLVPADLAGESFLVREAGSGTRAAFETFMIDAGVDRPLDVAELRSNETIKQSVMAGLGIAFISGHTVASELDARRLVLLNVAGLPVARAWYVVRRSDKRLLPAAIALRDFWLERGAGFLPRLAGIAA
ncbi:LysR family transcriptional regulator [Methylobrevis albus]|uniref:HTH-type transcriptional regulator CbbR n=1 Tax=Methylobrevis albus TaxID=2793297 RepID=A0A931HZS0_9HYPH|nr:LysR family transcriptional regulator [Methylobrevis albus]MBH0236764.1 LysR family transcriptional regulator [Methylobrevis albus]